MTQIKHVSFLILGAGWTSTFLIPLLVKEDIAYAATSTTGRSGTIKFEYDPADPDPNLDQYKDLPNAHTVLITFPLKGHGQSTRLTTLYNTTHPHAAPNYIQLGSTGIFQIPEQPVWVTRHSNYDKENDRAIAEDELLSLGGCVLNLSGLWGGVRQASHLVKRVAKTKAQLKEKKTLHMVHGQDVARGIVAVHRKFTSGERWMLTDMFVYDWWSLVIGWGENGVGSREGDADGPQVEWVRELMVEERVRALPRSIEQLGRAYDTREFWSTFDIAPVRARI
ncbi:hypothetical protein MMC13_000734 [Lambiella insularis]|nr:hypothetical protein [Lambiella insularis]